MTIRITGAINAEMTWEDFIFLRSQKLWCAVKLDMVAVGGAVIIRKGEVIGVVNRNDPNEDNRCWHQLTSNILNQPASFLSEKGKRPDKKPKKDHQDYNCRLPRYLPNTLEPLTTEERHIFSCDEIRITS